MRCARRGMLIQLAQHGQAFQLGQGAQVDGLVLKHPREDFPPLAAGETKSVHIIKVRAREDA